MNDDERKRLMGVCEGASRAWRCESDEGYPGRHWLAGCAASPSFTIRGVDASLLSHEERCQLADWRFMGEFDPPTVRALLEENARETTGAWSTRWRRRGMRFIASPWTG